MLSKLRWLIHYTSFCPVGLCPVCDIVHTLLGYVHKKIMVSVKLKGFGSFGFTQDTCNHS